MDKKILRQLLKNLQIIMRCPHCGKTYHLDEINLRGYNGQTYMLHMECSNCHIPVQASITVSENKTNQQINPIFPLNQINPFLIKKPIIPENSYQKPIIKKKLKPISADEVIDFHQMIKGFNGRFEN